MEKLRIRKSTCSGDYYIQYKDRNGWNDIQERIETTKFKNTSGYEYVTRFFSHVDAARFELKNIIREYKESIIEEYTID